MSDCPPSLSAWTRTQSQGEGLTGHHHAVRSFLVHRRSLCHWAMTTTTRPGPTLAQMVMQGGLVSPVVPAHRQGARFWQLPSRRLIAPKFLSLCCFWVRRGALGMSASSSMPLPRPLGLALSLLLFVAARFFADRQ
ncbi:unnamed protein product [Symbiodinium sp. KB8]|nr:unnamed protein product [Symbiodinium sp. KB8]